MSTQEPLIGPREIATEHWVTDHNGTHCVGCGWRPVDLNEGEDISHAVRRHIAEIAWQQALQYAIHGGGSCCSPGPFPEIDAQ